MRIVVTGATGNIGTALLAALDADPDVTEVVGLARRLPPDPAAVSRKATFAAVDVTRDDLGPHFRGADVVVHLAWAIQPSHALGMLHNINVIGSRRVAEAVAAARVPALVCASSVGAYSPGPKDRAVGESWPTDGIPTSYYSRHKAAQERILDELERSHPGVRVVRIRPSLTFDAHSAAHIGRLFVGRLVPKQLLGLLRVVPAIPGLRVQVTHASDMGRAFALAATTDAAGAYNVAADPVVDPDLLQQAFGGPKLPVPVAVARTAVDLSWRLRLQPTSPGWLDMALRTPLMDSSRIRALGWTPRHTSVDALRELFDGLRAGSGTPTPPLASRVPPASDPNVRVGRG